MQIRSTGDIPKESGCASIASPSNDCRRPNPGPDLNRGKDPNRLFLVVDDGANLVRLKLGNGDASYFSIIELTTRGGCLFEPAIDSIPANPLYSGDGGLIQTFDAESRNLIKGRMTVLESIVGCAGIGAESFAASAATISPPPPLLGFVESAADDVSETGFSRQCAFPVWAVETLHCF